MYVQFIVHAFRELLSMYVYTLFPFVFEDRMLDLTVLVPGHCLFFYFLIFPKLSKNLDPSYKMDLDFGLFWKGTSML